MNKNIVINGPIDEECYNIFLKNYKESASSEIEIEITTSGGSLTFALLICEIITTHPYNIMAYIPKYALAEGTIIALCCNKLRMAPYASLSSFNLQFKMPGTGISLSNTCLRDAVHLVNNREYTEPSVLQIMTEYFNSYLSQSDTTYRNKLLRVLKKRYINSQIDKILSVFQKQTFETYPIFVDEMPDFLKPTEADTVTIDEQEVSAIEPPKDVKKVLVLKKPQRKYVGRR